MNSWLHATSTFQRLFLVSWMFAQPFRAKDCSWRSCVGLAGTSKSLLQAKRVPIRMPWAATIATTVHVTVALLARTYLTGYCMALHTDHCGFVDWLRRLGTSLLALDLGHVGSWELNSCLMEWPMTRTWPAFFWSAAPRPTPWCWSKPIPKLIFLW